MRDLDSMSELNRAIHKKDVRGVQEVLLNNYDLLLDHEWRFLPLLNALLLDKNEEIVEFLIMLGADVNLKNPLGLALQEGSVRCIELLLKNGAKLEGPQWGEQSPAEFVFRRPKIDTRRRKEILQLLIRYGLNVKFRNRKDQNLLHLFAWYLKTVPVEIAEVLLDAGVPVDEGDNEGDTPLFYAIERRNVEFVSLLIKRGADVNKKSKDHEITPLYLAAQINDVSLVNLLLSNGADVNAKIKSGWTALHGACSDNSHQIIGILLKRGADINAENEDGRTPYSVIKSKNNDYICNSIMVKEFAKLSFENQYISNSDIDLMKKRKWFVEYKVSINDLSEMAKTKFYASYSYYSVLKMSKNINKLSKLTRNEEFVRNFKKNLNSQKFFLYNSDLVEIFKEAVELRNESQIVVNKLNSIFRDSFPDLVIRKLAVNLSLRDLPLE